MIKGKGKVIDLVFPILVLIICCIIGMIYTGGFFDGTGFVDAFAGSNASIGLMLGSFFALIITICFYSIRRVLSLRIAVIQSLRALRRWYLQYLY